MKVGEGYSDDYSEPQSFGSMHQLTTHAWRRVPKKAPIGYQIRKGQRHDRTIPRDTGSGVDGGGLNGGHDNWEGR